jgi:protein involved in polysaccharide export with SLBB domain
MDRQPVQASYLIGPGDELLIRAWGSIDLDSRVTVDRNGQIYLPKVGTINVAGLRYEQLERYLHSAMAQQFKDFDLSVNVGQLRSIQVFLLGEARRPGTYTVSSLSTMVNALFASGGPSSIGSMRDIQLKRDGRVVTHLDLYDLLVSGDKSKDVQLQPEDVIYIPPAGPRVAITGSVNTQAIFELRGPTDLQELLRYAGGLSAVAGSAHVTIEGVKNRTSLHVAEYTLDLAEKQVLQDGDIVRIFPVSPQFGNAVTLRGATAMPGRYPWRPGMRISDLIPSRDALVTRGYYARQDQLTQNSSDIFVAPAQAKPQDFRDNSAEINFDYAEITRLNPATLKTELMPFDLGEALANPSSSANVALQPGDVVTIFSEAELPEPVEKQDRFITIDGEVNVPGVYRVNAGQTLRDIVALAGGLTPHAYLFAADMRRNSTRIEQQQKLDATVARLRTEMSARASQIDPAATQDETNERTKAVAFQEQYISRLASFQPTGRIVLDIPADATGLDAIPALPLEDGDVLRIPVRGGTVQVLGAVNNDNALIYHPGGRVSEYLDKAGGPTREADLGRAFVIRADGSVVGHKGKSAHAFDSFVLMPGDAIVVPDRIIVRDVLTEVRDWSQIFAQFALGVAAAKVLEQ